MKLLQNLLLFLLIGLLSVASNYCFAANGMNISSPSGNHEIQFSLLDGVPHYSVSYEGKTILSDSALSLDFTGGEFRGAQAVERQQTRSQNDSWVPVVGSKSSYPDSFNEANIQLREATGQNRRLHLTFRAYDEGVAFRYSIPEQDGIEKLKHYAEDPEDKKLVTIRSKQVTTNDSLHATIGAGSGCAILIEPQLSSSTR